jgi:uncharacterized protein YggU (UPF0235/DUF167 family)
MDRKYELHNGQRGSALAVRVTPRASQNQISDVLNDSTVKVHLVCGPTDEEINVELLRYMAEVLGVPRSRIEIVAGTNGRDKLVSILDMDAETAHQRIVTHIA